MDSIPAPSSVQGHNVTEDARDPEAWQNRGDYSEGDVLVSLPQPQTGLEEASDPLASNQGQSLPGPWREQSAEWEVRKQHHLPNREPDQALPASASRKRLEKCGREGTGGELDLVCQRLDRSEADRLHCLGPLRERLTIWAAMDSIPAPSSVQGHNVTEDARDPEAWQNRGDYSEGDVLVSLPQPQTGLEEASDPLASNQGQSLPGPWREQSAEWEVRKQHHLPNREPDQALPASASRKRLEKNLQEDWEQEDKDEEVDLRLEHSPSAQAGSGSSSPEEVPDYLLQYRTIHSTEQQRAYEQDFEADYAQYRILHARVGAASQRFIELGAEIKRTQPGTPEHKVLEDKIVQEYKKFRKRYPGYKEEKHRCEYLHQKLSHIKGLILESEGKNWGS
ncbi:RNA polymerase II elongation factor ELL3 [Heterocephalus glaber]|uniref:RNA polymerase II elongation factor ELL3 n=1 Tax=Heterocephalus glaber TaxID=10181 RepID=G5BM54_HETGA|nr:RNA polymerase II elongation factor ELL3 [Heterocephalus glaber]